jgi:signal transduction histidine kinase
VPSSLSLLAAAAVIPLVLIVALVAQARRNRRRACALVHELNQPLTAILSNAQAAQRFLASDRLDLQELREILDDIVTDGQRAAGLVRRMKGSATD